MVKANNCKLCTKSIQRTRQINIKPRRESEFNKSNSKFHPPLVRVSNGIPYTGILAYRY